MSNDAAIPAIIRAAGEPAVRAYRAFLDDGRLSANTRRVYVNHVRRFCRWAETCELPLSLIAPFDIAAYLRPFSSHHAAYQALPVLRQFFIPFIAAGVLTSNPCGRRGWPRADTKPVMSPERFTWELRKLRRELMAELNEGHADDSSLDLVKSIDCKLASMAPTEDEPTGGTQEASDAR